MPGFSGFPEGKLRLTHIPSLFFRELLPQIDTVEELKLTLYILWRLDNMEGAFRYLRRSDITADQVFMKGLAADPGAASSALDAALSTAVGRGSLLKAQPQPDQALYFLNTPKGRSAVDAIARGEWRASGDPQTPVELVMETPNIFRLYEENFGPLTPLIADQLTEAEDTYPAKWIEEAFRIAVENNKRSWRYVSAILNRWQLEGPHAQQDRRDTEKSRRRYASQWEDSE